MLDNNNGLQEYSSAELLAELTKRIDNQHAIKMAVNQLYDDSLTGRISDKEIIQRMYDAVRSL